MVHLLFGKKGDQIFLTARGHAGYAAHGQDMVCAAATMLAYTLGQTAMVLAAEGKLEGDPSISIQSGDADIAFTPKAEHRAECLTSMRVIENGAQCLAGSFPGNCQIHYVGYGDEPLNITEDSQP